MDLHERLRAAADDSGHPTRTDAHALYARARTEQRRRTAALAGVGLAVALVVGGAALAGGPGGGIRGDRPPIATNPGEPGLSDEEFRAACGPQARAAGASDADVAEMEPLDGAAVAGTLVPVGWGEGRRLFCAVPSATRTVQSILVPVSVDTESVAQRCRAQASVHGQEVPDGTPEGIAAQAGSDEAPGLEYAGALIRVADSVWQCTWYAGALAADADLAGNRTVPLQSEGVVDQFQQGDRTFVVVAAVDPDPRARRVEVDVAGSRMRGEVQDGGFLVIASTPTKRFGDLGGHVRVLAGDGTVLEEYPIAATSGPGRLG